MSLTDHGDGFNGCFASHIVLRPGTAVFPIPAGVSDQAAAPINCALATMVNAVNAIPKPKEGEGEAVVQVMFRLINLFFFMDLELKFVESQCS